MSNCPVCRHRCGCRKPVAKVCIWSSGRRGASGSVQFANHQSPRTGGMRRECRRDANHRTHVRLSAAGIMHAHHAAQVGAAPLGIAALLYFIKHALGQFVHALLLLLVNQESLVLQFIVSLLTHNNVIVMAAKLRNVSSTLVLHAVNVTFMLCKVTQCFINTP